MAMAMTMAHIKAQAFFGAQQQPLSAPYALARHSEAEFPLAMTCGSQLGGVDWYW